MSVNQYITYLILTSFILLPLTLTSQNIKDFQFNNWQKKDGLPNNNINEVIKDNLGFLWIATNDGLCRYDGHNQLKIYRPNNQKENSDNSLASSNIIALFNDSRDNLWIGTRFGGLTRLHIPTNTWTTFQNIPNDSKSICNNEILSILEDRQNRLWIGTEKGLCLFDYQTETFTNFNDKSSISNKAILTIMEDDKGWIWLGTWSGGLYLLTEDRNKYDFRNIKLSTDKAANNVWSLYQDYDLRYWIGTHGGGLFLMNLPDVASNKINQQEWKPKFYSFSMENKSTSNIGNNAIQSILIDNNNQLWLGTVYGLYVADLTDFPKSINANTPSNKNKIPYLNLHQFLPVPFNSKALIGENVLSIIQDSQDMIWIGTTNGLTQFNRYSNQFKNFTFENSTFNLPNTPNIFVDNKNNIWLAASEKGLRKGNIKNKTIVFEKDKTKFDLIGKEVSSLFNAADEWLYVGTEEGVTKIHLPTSKTIHYPIPRWVKSEIKDFFIKTILVDNHQKVWLGTKVGLFTIHPKTGAYTHYAPDPNSPHSLSDHSINDIYQDSQGNIWLSTFNGLNLLKNSTNEKLEFVKFYFKASNPESSLPSNQITSFEEMGDRLFIGTLGGLCSYNFNTQKIESYTKNNSKFWIQALEAGNDGLLWGSTTEGIFSFDISNKKFQLYDLEDGLIVVSFGLGASCKAEDGTLIFTHNKGFTYFNPTDLIWNKKPPEVFITEVKKVNPKGEEILNTIKNEKIQINHDDYRISFNFAALNYNRGDKNLFAYQLKGFEDTWNYTSSNSPIVYTNLEPKDYTFHIKAANNNGVWNDIGAKIEVEKFPAFWETTWFKSLVLIGTLASILLLFYFYTSNIRKRNLTLQAYNQALDEEMKIRVAMEKDLKIKNIELIRSNEVLEQFAYAASHDLQEPLRVVGSFSGLFARRYKNQLDENGLEYLDFIQDGVTRISKLIRSLLNFSKIGKKDAILQETDVNKLVKEILHNLSISLEEKNVQVNLKSLPTIFGVEEQIRMVFYNLISNAVKFNNKEFPTINISEVVSENEDHWTFAITDNGIGIEPQYQKKIFEVFKMLHGKKEYEGIGIGLSIVKKIVNQHDGKIWLESELNKGSTFYFSISKKLKEELVIEKEQAFHLN